MKVCHITSVHPYNDTRILLKECCSMSKAGFDTHLVATNIPMNEYKDIKLHSVNCESENRLYRMTQIIFKIYKTAVDLNAEIYHFHDPELIPIGLLLKLRRKKVIYDIHEDYPKEILQKYWISAKMRGIVSKIFNVFENWSAKKFDYLVTATPSIADRFIKMGCHVETINNYSIVSEFCTDEVDWKLKENNACYVGGLTEIRGISNLIEAIGKTKGNLLLAGTFSPESFKHKVVKMKEWNCVKWLGQVDRKQMKEILAKSIVGVHILKPAPNHMEALPNKMFEYMSAGLPVIMSNFPLWKTIIEENGVGKCVDPLDVVEVARTIQWMIDNKEEAEKMGTKARELVLTKYNWDVEAEKLVNVYKKIGGGDDDKLC